MHPFSVLTLGIFVAGYITARWDLVTRLYELAGFAWNHGVVVGSYSRIIAIYSRRLTMLPSDSSREGFCCAFDPFHPFHHTNRALCRPRNVSGIHAPFQFLTSQLTRSSIHALQVTAYLRENNYEGEAHSRN